MAEHGHKAANASVSTTEPAISSKALFKGQRIISIEHNGEHYALRITASGKLILTK
ncbi:hemin uptake protein HemP [Pseudohongiella acticola]|jgi:hemin uptake protein HemP|uniref:hemin uptake protein HemP n=1 Tax=Pseudohongiella acticola TaxID=1524254 RepID=UPI0009F24081|nr:hemin uptake protein HemP [Pseudohongiella acticola]|tara:strand:+ start:342 stop:509 length:168 start_codon:yes stop_codon:yes gene_type:complete